MFARYAVLGWLAMALTSTACQQPAQEVGRLSEDDVAAIRDFLEVHRGQALAGDWEADAVLYTEDAVRLPPNGPPIRGRAAIQAAMAQVDTVLDFTFNTVEIDGRGDLAYVWNSYSVTSVPEGAVEPTTATGKAILILRKQPDGSWLFHRVIWNSNEPPPE